MTVRFDPAVVVNIQLRVDRNGSAIFRFVDTDGNPVDMTGTEWTMFLKTHQDSDDNVIELSIGDGLTISGNEITVSVTDELMRIKPKVYYYELYNVDEKRTWLNGDADVINGKWREQS